MAADLANAGIRAELYLEGDWATYLGSRREGRFVGLYMLGWGGDNGDPDNFSVLLLLHRNRADQPVKAGTRTPSWPSCCLRPRPLLTQEPR